MEEQLAKYFAGEASDSEKDAVNVWRSESEENARMYFEFKETWLLVSRESNELPSLELNKEEKEVKVIGWPNYLKYAAAVVLLGMIGAIWFFNQEEGIESPAVFAGTSTILEDGSVVSLKKGAEISKMEFTEGERKIYLSGKAFFEVEHDPARPFYVITDDATIRVLGTSFQVNSDQDFTEVRVKTGLVAFSTNDPSKSNLSLNLEKGEMGMIGKNIRGVVKRRNDNENFLSWKDGILSFERAKTSDVIESLEDTYNIEIEMPDKLMNCRLTAQFTEKPLEEVIQILAATFSWTYEIDKDKVVLSGEGC